MEQMNSSNPSIAEALKYNSEIIMASALKEKSNKVKALTQNKFGQTALMRAAANCPINPSLIKLLIDCGASPNHADIYGFKALDYALANEHRCTDSSGFEMAKSLLENSTTKEKAEKILPSSDKSSESFEL